MAQTASDLRMAVGTDLRLPSPRPDDLDAPRSGLDEPRNDEQSAMLADLLARKGATTVTVCLPARNHAGTIGPIVEAIARDLVRDCRLVDEILVVDAGSTDDTADEAAHAGATVLLADELFVELGPVLGRGDLLWRSVGVAMGDLIVWIDPDLTTFSSDYVVRLLQPLMTEHEVVLVRGTARRALDGEGGGVAEAVARPVLTLLNPDFSTLREPFSGEYAGRRGALRQVPFEPDYGVEIGLLVDLAQRFGPAAVREVEINGREHRFRPLSDRAQQTRQMLRAALSRAGASSSVRGALPLRPAHGFDLDDPTKGGDHER